MTDLVPLHFYDDPIEVLFDSPPALEKSPPCPNGFVWNGQTFRGAESLSERADFTRRGRAMKNVDERKGQWFLYREMSEK